MAEISHSVLVAYFQNIQINLKGLEDFFRMDLAEVKSSFRSGADFPCLVAESHESDFGDSKPNQTVQNRFFAFTVFYNPEKGNFTEQNEMLDASEKMGLKIIARMKYDSNKPDHFLFNRFKAESVKNHKVGPLFNEQLYGYRFTGEILATQPLVINADDWEDIDSVCS